MTNIERYKAVYTKARELTMAELTDPDILRPMVREWEHGYNSLTRAEQLEVQPWLADQRYLSDNFWCAAMIFQTGQVPTVDGIERMKRSGYRDQSFPQIYVHG